MSATDLSSFNSIVIQAVVLVQCASICANLHIIFHPATTETSPKSLRQMGRLAWLATHPQPPTQKKKWVEKVSNKNPHHHLCVSKITKNPQQSPQPRQLSGLGVGRWSNPRSPGFFYFGSLEDDYFYDVLPVSWDDFLFWEGMLSLWYHRYKSQSFEHLKWQSLCPLPRSFGGETWSSTSWLLVASSQTAWKLGSSVKK